MVNGSGGMMKNVHWLSFSLYLVASAISFAAIGGIYVTTVDNRIERNREHLERVDALTGLHREQIASMKASQAATETAAARLEERIAAQGAALQRIEELLRNMTSEAYGPSRP